MANPAPDSAGKGLDVSHSTGLHTQDAGDVEVEALCAGTGTANTIQPSLSWEGLRVMESHLPGAGKGLFAASAFRCEFSSLFLCTSLTEMLVSELGKLIQGVGCWNEQILAVVPTRHARMHPHFWGLCVQTLFESVLSIFL